MYHGCELQPSSDAILPLPASRLVVLNALGRVWLALILVLADIRIRIILLIKVSKRVVDLAVLALVRADVQQQVAHSTLAFRHIPVLDRNVRRHHLLPLRKSTSVEICDLACVRQHCLFFKIADEAVACSRRDEVGDEHGVEEDALRSEDHELHEGTGFGHFEEGQEVHALVVGFFEQGFDPAVVTLHAAHAVKVTEHACYHSGDAGDGFEEDVSEGIVSSCFRELVESMGSAHLIMYLRSVMPYFC